MRRRNVTDDGGYTLSELLVVIILMAIVGGVVAMAATTGLKKQTQVADRNDTMAQIRTALQRVDRDIRSAAQVEWASNTKLVLYESQTSTHWAVTYQLVADGASYDLQVTRDDQPSVTTILLRDVVNSATSPVFTYVAKTGYTAPDSSVNATTCVWTAIGKSPYAQNCIGTIIVKFQVQPSTLAQPVQGTDKGTELRNAA